MRRFRKMREDPDLFSMEHPWQNIGLRLMSVDLQITDLLHLNRRTSARDSGNGILDVQSVKGMVSLDIGIFEAHVITVLYHERIQYVHSNYALMKEGQTYPYFWQCPFHVTPLQFSATKSQICKCLWVSEVWERRWCCGTKARPMWGMVQLGDRFGCGHMRYSLEEILFAWGSWATPTINI